VAQIRRCEVKKRRVPGVRAPLDYKGRTHNILERTVLPGGLIQADIALAGLFAPGFVQTVGG
jgi:hypothetical protein